MPLPPLRYDGGGIYRNVWFTAVESPGPVIAPWGVYCGGSVPTGAISWDAQGNPSADRCAQRESLWTLATFISHAGLAHDMSATAAAAAASALHRAKS